MMYLSDNLRWLRKERKLSQNDIAEVLGYKSFTTIQKWETGVNEPPFGVVKKLAEYYGVNIQDLAYKDLSQIRSFDNIELSDNERQIITAFRNSDSITKQMVLRALSLDKEEEKRNSKENSA